MARNLDGINQYMRVNPNTTLSTLLGAFGYTVMSWVRPHGPFGDFHGWSAPSIFGDTNGYWGVGIGKSSANSIMVDSYLAWTYNVALGGPGGGSRMCSFPLTLNTWQHVAMTFEPGSPGTLSLYVDGVFRANVTANQPDNTSGFMIFGTNWDQHFANFDFGPLWVATGTMFATEIAALARGTNPWKTWKYGGGFPIPLSQQTLFAPLWGIHNPEPIFTGAGSRNITFVNGTPAVVLDGPPIARWVRRPLPPPVDTYELPPILPYAAIDTRRLREPIRSSRLDEQINTKRLRPSITITRPET